MTAPTVCAHRPEPGEYVYPGEWVTCADCGANYLPEPAAPVRNGRHRPAPRPAVRRIGHATPVDMEPDSDDPPEPPADMGSESVDTARSWRDRMVNGGAFIHDTPDHVPAVWGTGDDVLWAEGEPLIVTGPTGVGKTTLGGQLVAARLGLLADVLGYPVQPGRRVLYLAMDRPAQIRRALARVLRAHPRDVLDQRLIAWRGPPPGDIARNPMLLRALADEADADTVVIDSLKDAAVKLSDEETGQGISRAMNYCVTNGVEVLASHHQTKRGAGGQGKPNSLADVYGSAWITAGAGSVVLLWGTAGDLVVDLVHLKQPSDEVGPLRIVHDHERGMSHVDRDNDGVDVLALLRFRSQSVPDVARAMFGDPTAAQTQKARRKLDRLVRDGLAVKLDDAALGGPGGSSGARYGAAALILDSPTESPTRRVPGESTHAIHGAPTIDDISAGQAINGGAHATHAPEHPRTIPPLKEGGVDAASVCERCRRPAARLVLGRCPACAYPGSGREDDHTEDAS